MPGRGEEDEGTPFLGYSRAQETHPRRKLIRIISVFKTFVSGSMWEKVNRLKRAAALRMPVGGMASMQCRFT